MTADQRLLAALAAIDRLDADGVGLGARLQSCTDCGRRILVGLDGDRCALVARTDPHEIDALGEYLALRIGLPTYNLIHGFSPKGKRRWELAPRWKAHIESPRRSAVVAAHRCGLRLPAAKQTWPMPPPTTVPPAGSVPPF